MEGPGRPGLHRVGPELAEKLGASRVQWLLLRSPTSRPRPKPNHDQYWLREEKPEGRRGRSAELRSERHFLRPGAAAPRVQLLDFSALAAAGEPEADPLRLRKLHESQLPEPVVAAAELARRPVQLLGPGQSVARARVAKQRLTTGFPPVHCLHGAQQVGRAPRERGTGWPLSRQQLPEEEKRALGEFFVQRRGVADAEEPESEDVFAGPIKHEQYDGPCQPHQHPQQCRRTREHLGQRQPVECQQREPGQQRLRPRRPPIVATAEPRKSDKSR